MSLEDKNDIKRRKVRRAVRDSGGFQPSVGRRAAHAAYGCAFAPHAHSNRAMRGEKDAIFGHFQELKGRMNKFREREAMRLQELTINSQSAIKLLTVTAATHHRRASPTR